MLNLFLLRLIGQPSMLLRKLLSRNSTIVLLAVASLLFSVSLCAQTPRLYVQWGVANPKGFQRVSDWAKLPSKPYISGAIDDTPGWIAAVRIDGKVLAGCDHYAIVTDQRQTHITSYCWMDGQGVSFGVAARVCTHEQPLQCTYYGNPDVFRPYTGHPALFMHNNGGQALPMDQFKEPPAGLIRHGIYLKNWTEHKNLW